MIIEVWTKEKYSVNEEAGLIGRLAHAGLPVKTARLSRLYKIEAPFHKKDFDRIAAELLTDKITERYSLSARPALFPKGPKRCARPGLKKFYRVEVWLKNSVTDVVGESVKEAIRDIMGGQPRNVRFGRAYYIACGSESRLKRAVSTTLMNEIVNVYSVTKGKAKG
ncbi:MAG: phosphoribosylformylglycinamidine synthase subunit PurS [Elusimicrobia bacterium]|nr:phosphoribosylformylglycinamidine synthase subunit PurS [Elusimicrobiota bacterium]